jgi:hypothetical protein
MTGMCWERPKFMRIREELFRGLSKGIFGRLYHFCKTYWFLVFH